MFLLSCLFVLSESLQCAANVEAYQKIAVAMGYTGASHSDDIEVIDLASTLTGCLNLPPLRSVPLEPFVGTGGLGYGNIPIICGGSPRTKVCHSLANGAWQAMPNLLNMERENFQMVKSPYPNDGSKLFITGGYTLNSNINSTEILTTGGWKLGTDTPVEIYNHCMVLMNLTTVMVISGHQFVTTEDDRIGGVSNKTFFFNTETNKWSEGPELNRLRTFHSCAMIKKDSMSQEKSVIVVGGTVNSFGNSTEILDERASYWRCGPEVPVVHLNIAVKIKPLTVHGGAMVEDPQGGVVYIGGNDGEVRQSIYRLAHGGLGAHWILMQQKLKIPRFNHFAFLIPKKLANCF